MRHVPASALVTAAPCPIFTSVKAQKEFSTCVSSTLVLPKSVAEALKVAQHASTFTALMAPGNAPETRLSAGFALAHFAEDQGERESLAVQTMLGSEDDPAQSANLLFVDEPCLIRDLLGTAYLQALTLFDDLDELRRFQE